MDPLTAVGLAANVAQLIDLSWKVVSKSRDLYQNGALPEHRDTVAVTSDLRSVNTRLVVQLKQFKDGQDLEEDDAALRDLCESSNRIADALIQRLQKLSTGSEPRRWKSLRQALKSVWAKSELDDAAARLQSFRLQLNTRILVTLRDRIERLHQSTQTIASNIGETRTFINTSQEIQTEYLTRLISSQHDRTREVVHNLALGSPPSYGNWLPTTSPFSETTDRKQAEADFLQAVKDKDMACLRKTLRINPAVIFAYNEEGQTALHVACEMGDEDIVTYLIRNGAKINPDDDYGNIPLHYAARAEHLGLVRALLIKGADAHAKNGEGQIAHDLCNSASLLAWMLTYGPNVETKNERGIPALFHFSVLRDLDAVRALLKLGASVNACDSQDRVPMFVAAEHGHNELLQLLLEHGAPVDPRDRGSRTPLMASAWHGHARSIELLLDAGAEIDAVNEYGFSAVDECCRHGRTEAGQLLIHRGASLDRCTYEGYSPLQQAAMHGYIELVESLLQKGCDVNLPNPGNGWTALHEACFHGHLNTVKLLVSHGAATELLSAHGYGTPLHHAVAMRRTDVVEYLIDHARANVEAVDEHDRTPLGLAQDKDDINAAKSLVQRGADVNARYHDKGSLLRVAVLKGQQDMVQLLLDNGADIKVLDDCDRPPLLSAIQRNTAIADLLRAHVPEGVVYAKLSTVT